MVDVGAHRASLFPHLGPSEEHPGSSIRDQAARKEKIWREISVWRENWYLLASKPL
jgi:hypothetical protein